MSGDYLVLAWAEADDGARRQAQAHSHALLQRGWGREIGRAGLEVWVRGARRPPVRAEGSDIVVIGRTEPRLSSQREPPMSSSRGPFSHSAATTATAAAVAERLCRDSWGSFVAIIRGDAGGIPHAFRDPSGALDALTWRCRDLFVVASELDDLPRALGPDALALDWDVIVDLVRRPAAVAGRCALRGVEPVAPGALQRLGHGGEAALTIWSPLDWISADAAPAPSEARRLRRTIVETVGALASHHSVLLAEVSGGLDSSIVAAALGAGGFQPRVAAALHYVGDLRESDERRWAEQLCRRWGLPLVCAQRALAPFDPEHDLEPLAHGARPPVAALDSWRDADLAHQLRARQAQALFTGMGGDAVFFQMPTATVLADLRHDRGPAALLDPLVRDVARWLRRSVWSVAAESLAAGHGRPDLPPPAFLGARATAPASGPSHPWLVRLADAPPAKRLQIASLAALQGLLGRSRRTDAAEVVHPLLAQPVVECCLSIPAWRHVEGGRDRALARIAMGELMPPEVVNRRSKGELTSHFARRVAASGDLLKSYLLDGALVRAEVLDAAAVEAALDPDNLIRSSDGLSLISAAAVEAWVRWWQGQVPDARSAPRRR